MFQVSDRGQAVRVDADTVEIYALEAGSLPVRCLAFYAVAPEGTVADAEKPYAVGIDSVEAGYMVSRYARLTREGDVLLARVPGKNVPAPIAVKPSTVVLVSLVTTKTSGVRLCGHAACVASLGAKHVPDRIDRTGATYCVTREAVPTPTRPVRKELAVASDGKWMRHVEYVAAVEAGEILADTDLDAEAASA